MPTLPVAIKILLWTSTGLLAAFHPLFADKFFRSLEQKATAAARHPALSCLALASLVLLMRAALLPLWPIPKPVIFDEFSYILQADTFAHGRLTNPTHPLWPFFESAFVLNQPTYASKYPPGQSLALAAGQAIFGDPWFGVWLSCGLLAAALLWTFQGWLPARWALYGGFLAIPLTLTSYWMNSYWGGAVAAIGGALVLGGYARVVLRDQPVYALAIGIGIAILVNTRPYEGLIFCIPVAIALLLSRPRATAIALVLAVLIPAFAATAYYNRAVTGHALRLPYSEYSAQYSYIPLFNFQPLKTARTDLTPAMSDLHLNWELNEWKKSRSWRQFQMRFDDWKSIATRMLGTFLLGVLIVIYLPNLWRDRRIRLPLLCVLASLAGSSIEIFYNVHYFAPATAALLIVTVQAFRHLRQWKTNGRPAGRFLTRAVPILVVGSALATQAFMIARGQPAEPQTRNSKRDDVIALLNDFIDKHVILVRYTGSQSPHEEWVYNGADIDGQDVIWAHDLGPAKNARLIEYYKGRKIWLFQPDIDVLRLNRYGEQP